MRAGQIKLVARPACQALMDLTQKGTQGVGVGPSSSPPGTFQAHSESLVKVRNTIIFHAKHYVDAETLIIVVPSHWNYNCHCCDCWVRVFLKNRVAKYYPGPRGFLNSRLDFCPSEDS